MIAVGFPTKFEAEDCLRALGNPSLAKTDGVEYASVHVEGTDILIAVLGIGTTLSAKSAQILFQHFPIKIFILAGFAGALSPALKRGQILIAQGGTSEETMNDIKLLQGFDIARLYTSETLLATAEEKSRIASLTGCQFVDMETTAIAPIVRANGSEFIVVRAISDLADENLPFDVLAKGYDYAEGQTTPMKMALHLLLHPKKIKSLKQFLEPLPQIRKKLTNFLIELIKYLGT